MTFHATRFLLSAPALGFVVMLSRFTNSDGKPVAANTRSAFALSRTVKNRQGGYECFVGIDIQVINLPDVLEALTLLFGVDVKMVTRANTEHEPPQFSYCCMGLVEEMGPTDQSY